MAGGVKSRNQERSQAVLYLYGITRASSRTPRIDSEGVDGVAPIEPLTCQGFHCWISRVSRGDFADHLPERMEDLEWLAAASVRHQRAVSAIASHSDVLPARFATVFSDEASLQADISRRKPVLLRALKRIAGAEEWGVKVFAVPQRAAAAVPAASGKEYLRAKAVALHSRLQREPSAEVRQLSNDLRKLSVASAPTGKISGAQPNLEWQSSFLVPRKKVKDFKAILERFGSKWKDQRWVECTGPWPPYSFVSEDVR
jgi:hypothetical protein